MSYSDQCQHFASAVQSNTIESYLKAAKTAGQLKQVYRNCKVNKQRSESVADHCFRLTFMLAFACSHMEKTLNFERVIKMALVHDLVEAYTGDVPFSHYYNKPKIIEEIKEKENEAINKIRSQVGNLLGQELYQLWIEFEEQKTVEAQLVFNMDKLESILQFNEVSKWDSEKHSALSKDASRISEKEPFIRKTKQVLIDEALSIINGIA